MARFVAAIIAALCVAGCGTQPPQPTAAENAALRDSLVAMVEHWERAWEPQRMNESEAVALAMAPFAHDSSFSMVIDALYYPTYEARANTTPLRIHAARLDERETKHATSTVRFLRLGPDAAAMTMLYRYDFTKTSGRQGYQNSAYTFVFVRTPGGWRIAQYHGSHGREMFPDTSQATP